MDKHTKGRLLLSSTFLVCDEEAKIVAQCQPPLDVQAIAPTVQQAEANARRLVACWNACDGIGTEALEHIRFDPPSWNAIAKRSKE